MGIPVPQDRESPSKSGLIGKISLNSSMSQEEIKCLEGQWTGSVTFPFEVLQPIGGSSKSLTVPALSNMYV